MKSFIILDGKVINVNMIKHYKISNKYPKIKRSIEYIRVKTEVVSVDRETDGTEFRGQKTDLCLF